MIGAIAIGNGVAHYTANAGRALVCKASSATLALNAKCAFAVRAGAKRYVLYAGSHVAL